MEESKRPLADETPEEAILVSLDTGEFDVEEFGAAATGTGKEPQPKQISPFRIAANPLKRQLQYLVVYHLQLSHQ